MKGKIHIKTGDFEFIEIDFEGTPQEFIEQDREIKMLHHGGDGLSPKEWNKFLDRYVKTNIVSAEDYPNLNKWQQLIIQEIKKSKNRMDKIEEIKCACDPSCGTGEEGEVAGHIEDCSCGECHRLLSKLR